MTQTTRAKFLGSARESGAAKALNTAMGLPVKLLTQFAGSETARKLGLLEPAERWLYRGAKEGLRTATKAASRFKKRPAAGEPDRLKPAKKRAVFDLTLSADQQMTRETMHRFAETVMRPAAEEADASCAPPGDLLQQSHELGLTMMAVPESVGGFGEERLPASNAIIAEDLAWGDMDLAFAALAPLGVVNALVDWGTAEQQARYLPSFAGEEFVPAALALLEPEPLFDPGQMRTGAVRKDGGYRLYGTKCMVPLGESAELFIVAANTMGLGTRLYIVEQGVDGLTVEREPTMGLRGAGLCRLTFDGVEVSSDAMLAEPGRDGFDLNDLVDRARIAWSAMAVGTCQAVLDYVKTYCNERMAFGEPITNRQAVAFLIADIAIELEGMRLLVYRAASRAEQGLSFHREAYLARIQCSEKGMKIGSDGVQLLGGHGFVKDHPVERWYRQLRAIAIMEGGLLV